MGMFGDIANVVTGITDQHHADDSAKLAYSQQKEFAQNGIRWKVEDANRAGIHPLAALGAMPASFTPVSLDNSASDRLADGLAGLGDSAEQAYDQATAKSRTSAERAAALAAQQEQTAYDRNQDKINGQINQARLAADLEGSQLDNEFKRLQIRNALNPTQAGPPMPGDMSSPTANGYKIVDNQIPHSTIPGVTSGNQPFFTPYTLPNGKEVLLPSQAASEGMEGGGEAVGMGITSAAYGSIFTQQLENLVRDFPGNVRARINNRLNPLTEYDKRKAAKYQSRFTRR